MTTRESSEVKAGVNGNNEGGLVMVHFTAEGEEASQGDGAERGASIGEGAGVKEGRGEKCELFVLFVAVYNHHKRIFNETSLSKWPAGDSDNNNVKVDVVDDYRVELEKSNILLIGPSVS
ncbi:hypothetical protein D0Y65_006777, partial [Glycine soja]